MMKAMRTTICLRGGSFRRISLSVDVSKRIIMEERGTEGSPDAPRDVAAPSPQRSVTAWQRRARSSVPRSSHEADRSRMDLTQDMTSPAAAPRADNGAEERPSAPQQEQNRAASAAAPPAKGHRLETWRTRGRGRGSRGPHPYAEPRRSWAPPRTQDPEAPMGAPPPHLPPRGYGPPRDYDNGPLVEGAAWAERDREREGRGNGHPPFEGRERDWEGAAPVPYAETRGVCPRCGRDNHPLRDCQAIKDIHGRYLSDPPPSRHRDSIKCHRCGRSGHLTRNCVQARDVDGRDIPSPPGVVPFEPGTADASSFRCVRCGRAGHPFRECAYARDIHGHIIHAPPGAVPPPRHPDGRPPTHPRGPESPARGARWEPPPAERRLPYIEDVALHPAGPHGSRSRSRSPRPRPLPSSSPSPPPPPSMPSPSRSASVPRGAEEGAAREERREEGGPRGGGGRGSESGSESDEGHGDPGARADRRGDASDAPGSSRNGSAADGTRGEAAEGDGPPARLAQGLGAASVPPAWGSGGLIKKAKEHAQRQEAPGRADPQPGGAPGPSREAEEPPREHRPAPAPAAPAPPSAVDRGGLAAAPAGPSPSTTAAGWATFGIPAPPLGAPAAPAAVPGNPLAAAAPSGVPYGPAGGAPGVPPPEGPTLDESEQEVQLMLPSAGVVIHYPVYFHFGRGLLQNRHGTLLPTFAGDVRMLVSEGRLLEESLADMSQRGEVAWGEADMQDDDVVR